MDPPSFHDPSRLALALSRQAEDDFGIRLSALVPVTGGEDVGAEVFKGSAADGGAVALKATRRNTVAGLLVAAALADKHVAGVPSPRLSRSGLPWSERDGWQVSLVPWINGSVAADIGMTEAQWRAYGRLLASVHSTSVSPALRKHLPQEDHHTAALRRAETVAAHLAGRRGSATSGADEISTTVLDLWRGRSGALQEVVRMTGVLGERLRALPRHDVLCHGDAHTVNVVVDDGGDVWLLDWDEVVLAPRERDLMFVLGGVIASAPVSEQEQARFFEGYQLDGPADIDPVRLAYYRCSWAVQDVADYADRALDQRRTADQRTHALTLLRSILSPTGIVEQALASLRQISSGRLF